MVLPRFNPNSEVENERRHGLWGAYASGVWFLGVAPETSSHQFFRAGNSWKCVSRKFGRDARTHTRDACAPHSYFGVRVKTITALRPAGGVTSLVAVAALRQSRPR